MNFNFSLFFISFLIIGCGVKSDPVPPEGTGIPSYPGKFLQKIAEPTETKTEEVKKKKE